MSVERRAAKQYAELSALAAAQPEEIRTRRQAAEETYSTVRARLGTAGTYDLPGTVGTGTATPGSAAADDPGVWRTEKAQTDAATRSGKVKLKPHQIADITRLDPEAYTKRLEGSAEFRIASRLTAEAEQLIAREGPMYDELLRNTQLPILEGGAAMARENAALLRRAAQRGGAARRGAMEAVQQIRALEASNRTKVTALADTRLKIDMWARENARTQLKFNENWSANLGGIRESFNQSMDMASELMVNSALPRMFAARTEQIKWKQYAHDKNRSKVTKILMGVGAAAAAFTGNYGLAVQMGAQALGQIPSPASPQQAGGGLGIDVGDLQFGGLAEKLFGGK